MPELTDRPLMARRNLDEAVRVSKRIEILDRITDDIASGRRQATIRTDGSEYIIPRERALDFLANERLYLIEELAALGVTETS
jgi:hypothetical protein